ncbi:serine O-acetyltransferase [Peribacillus sp. NPDC060253]|uniref:serine O-acetyltransferase n=1 Tax=Peribacillus sp. NPDC060253 TaxID=3347084 RepID=UPI00364A6BF5
MKLKKIWENVNLVRSLPSTFAYKLSRNKSIINKDIEVWVQINNLEGFNYSKIRYLNWLLVNKEEFRNLFYTRLNNNLIAILLGIFFRKLNSLYISTRDIGPGLFISHGFSTIILANRIGENCWINQQVTIGTKNGVPTPPTIGDNVRIGAGAIVVGDIKIGNNSFIGAGAVVAKDVPENSVIIGNPAILLKKDGVKVNQRL